MTATTSPQLTKLLLLACDQSYFDDTHLVSGTLQSLDDKATESSGDPYNDPAIYRSISPFDEDGLGSGYLLHRTIERPEIGAKLVIYRNEVTGDVKMCIRDSFLPFLAGDAGQVVKLTLAGASADTCLLYTSRCV